MSSSSSAPGTPQLSPHASRRRASSAVTRLGVIIRSWKTASWWRLRRNGPGRSSMVSRTRCAEPEPSSVMEQSMTELATDGHPLLYDESVPGRAGYLLPPLDVPRLELEGLLPGVPLRRSLPLPEVGELEVVRHFIRLSHRNHAIDVGFYPLGSCTMKYNPKINEEVVALPGIAGCHPYQPDDQVQGELALLWALERLLCEVGGMDRATLQPAAGAAGEFTGLLIIRAYHRHRGEAHRDTVIVPDSSHGTNPATAARCGFKTVSIKSGTRGRVELEALKAAVNERTAAIMLTNPNTLGLF